MACHGRPPEAANRSFGSRTSGDPAFLPCERGNACTSVRSRAGWCSDVYLAAVVFRRLRKRVGMPLQVAGATSLGRVTNRRRRIRICTGRASLWYHASSEGDRVGDRTRRVRSAVEMLRSRTTARASDTAAISSILRPVMMCSGVCSETGRSIGQCNFDIRWRVRSETHPLLEQSSQGRRHGFLVGCVRVGHSGDCRYPHQEIDESACGAMLFTFFFVGEIVLNAGSTGLELFPVCIF